MAKVSQLNLNRLHEKHQSEISTAINEVVSRSAFIGGQEVEKFERSFADWIGPDNLAVSCANGTDAITLATLALKIEPGSEAILPAMTYFATAEGVKNAGLKVKLVDVDPHTWVMNPENLEKAFTSKTQVIVPVHLYGQMAPMEKIRKIADLRGLKILEDASQAHGAKINDKPVGYYSDIATYSLYPGKNLGAFGDAGVILTKSKEYWDQCRKLRNHGGIVKYEHDVVGFNSRLDNLQAAILNVKMKYINTWNIARRHVANTYENNLKGVSGLQLPKVQNGAFHIFHQYVVLVENRVAFMEHMKKYEVETAVHYPRALHQLTALQPEFKGLKFPEAERVSRCAVSLPMCPTLTGEEVSQVINAVREFFANTNTNSREPGLLAA